VTFQTGSDSLLKRVTGGGRSILRVLRRRIHNQWRFIAFDRRLLREGSANLAIMRRTLNEGSSARKCPAKGNKRDEKSRR
jgi:hypothetical protein